MIFYSTYIDGANFIAKVRWESGFLRLGLLDPPPPLGTNGSKSTFVMHLSVTFISDLVLLISLNSLILLLQLTSQFVTLLLDQFVMLENQDSK